MIDLDQLDRLMELTPPAWLPADAEYDDQDQRVAVASTTRRVVRYDSPKRSAQRLGRRGACVDQLGQLPTDSEEIILLLDGRWHGWDLVAAIRELAGRPISQLHVATLGFNRDQTHQLAADLDAQQIGRVSMLVSEMFRDKNSAEFSELKQALTERGQQLAATRNHAKLLCLELEDGRRFACHGSLNLRRCNSVEQLAISTEPTLYGFFTSYIQQAVEAAG